MEGKKTPLYDTHVKYGGSIVDFGGFLLPVQYEAGIKKEHMAVRTECGLFDVSHMGEILVQGEKALEFLNHVLTNDYTDLKDGCARYSPMCNENGGTVDDLIVYKKADNDYFVVVSAANTEKDFRWMVDHKIDGPTYPQSGASWHCRVRTPRRFWRRLRSRKQSRQDTILAYLTPRCREFRA